MPEVMNEPKKEIKNIKEIWFGKEIDGIRKKHLCNDADDIKICSKCTFKDVFKCFCLTKKFYACHKK